MATTLALSIQAKFGWVYENVLTLGNTQSNASFSYAKSFTNGTGADNCDLLYAVTSTLAASTALNLDLAGSVANFFGTTLTFARIKAIYVEITTDTAGGPVLVGGHATAALANWITSADTLNNDQPAVRVRNGGCLLLCAPDATAYAVTATTGDILKFLNESGSVAATYKIAIAGASA